MGAGVEPFEVEEGGEIFGGGVEVVGEEGGAECRGEELARSSATSERTRNAHDGDTIRELRDVQQLEYTDELVRCGFPITHQLPAYSSSQLERTMSAKSGARNVQHALLELLLHSLLRLLVVKYLPKPRQLLSDLPRSALTCIFSIPTHSTSFSRSTSPLSPAHT